MTLRLGDLLVRNGALTEAQRDAVVDYQRLTGRPFGELAERLFGVGQQSVEQAWAEQYGMIAQRIDPRTETVDPEALSLMDRRQAWQFRVMPMHFVAGELMLCTTQDHLVRALKFAGWRVQTPTFMVLADALSLGEALMRYYPMAGMNPGVVNSGKLGIA